jgi:hypothetical protein
MTGGSKGGGLNILDSYNTLLENNPILAKSVTCLVIASIGDVICQRLSPGFIAIDLKRLLTFGIAQFLYFGPVMHYWFQLMDKVPAKFGMDKPNTPKWQTVLATLLVDQTAGSVLVISGFFVLFGFVTNLMDGTLLSTGVPAIFAAGISKVKNDLWPTLLANWRLWPAANAINFALVPLQYRVGFSNLVAVFWNIYLSSAVRK